MQAFRNAGGIAMRFVQGRRLFGSIGGYDRFRKPTKRRALPQLVEGDPFGRPMPRPLLMEAIRLMKRLSDREKIKFGFVFSEILGLPKPPEPAKGTGFAVKLVKFDPDRKIFVLGEVAWLNSLDAIKVVKDLSELGLKPSMDALNNVPCVIKEGVSKEEANEIIAKIKAAGGVAVMEPME